MRRISCAAWLAAAALALPATAGAAVTDGQWALIDQQGAGHRLLTLNPPGSGHPVGERVLHTAPAGVPLADPEWSPDGNRIVFAEGTRVLLYDVPAAKLTEVAPEGRSAVWTPDGSRIAFLRAGALVTRVPDGSAEQTLPVDGSGAQELSFSPSGELTLWVDGGRLDIVDVDGRARGTIDDRARGTAAWAPDGRRFVFPRLVGDTPLVGLWEVSAERQGGIGIASESADPEFSPSGTTLLYTRTQPVTRERRVAWVSAGAESSLADPRLRPADVDWQPCVAGQTVSCVSVFTPPPRVVIPLTCRRPAATLYAISGRSQPIAALCPGATGYEIVTAPAHGTAVGGTGLAYISTAGYTGPDTFSFRPLGTDGRVGEPVQVTLQVNAPRVKPAAPRLALVPGTLKLNRGGRVTVRGTCDRECVVALRVRVKLTSGGVIDGRLVRARAAAGGAVKLVLKRGKLPPRRKVAWARVSGTATGADGRVRDVRLTLR